MFMAVAAEARKHQELEHKAGGIYIRQFIFGTEDGLIGNLGLITGVSVATLSPGVVILAGIALMLTQAVSMSAGTYLSIKSQHEYFDHVLEQEKREIKEIPDIEREEVRQIYHDHGFRGKDLELLVKKITSNTGAWLSVMMAEEFGLSKKGLEHPLKASFIMALSVMLGAFIPLLPFFFLATTPGLMASIFATIIALFVFGAAKTSYTTRRWFISGLEMMLVGGVAAGAGYLIGSTFQTIFGIVV